MLMVHAGFVLNDVMLLNCFSYEMDNVAQFGKGSQQECIESQQECIEYVNRVGKGFH